MKLGGGLAAVLAGWVIATASPAWAAGPDEAKKEATKAANDAARFFDQKKFAEACALFEKSIALDSTPARQMSLGHCQEKLGRLGSALKTYRVVLKGSSVAYQLTAKAAIAKLEPTVPVVVVSVPAPARVPGLVVAVDGAPLDAADWDKPQPLDPGVHTISARAPERTHWQTTVDASAKTANVAVPVLEEDRVSAAAQGTQLVALKRIGGAEWRDGLGFVAAGGEVAPPSRRAAPVLPPMLNDDLSRTSVGWDAGGSLYDRSVTGVRTDLTVRAEFRRKRSWVAPWFDVRGSGGYVPKEKRAFFGGGGDLGVDVHPMRWTWLGAGPSFGYDALAVDRNGNFTPNHGPEIGILNVRFRTAESAIEPPLFDATIHLDERFALTTDRAFAEQATFVGTRLSVGGVVRFRAFVEGRLAGDSFDRGVRTGEHLYAGIGIGSAE